MQDDDVCEGGTFKKGLQARNMTSFSGMKICGKRSESNFL